MRNFRVCVCPTSWGTHLVPKREILTKWVDVSARTLASVKLIDGIYDLYLTGTIHKCPLGYRGQGYLKI